MSREPRQIDADNEGALYGEEDLVVEKQSLSLGSFTGGRKAKKALAKRAAAPVRPVAEEPETPSAEVQPVAEAAPAEPASLDVQQETVTPEIAMTKDEKIVPEKEIAVTPEAQKTEPEKAEASATAAIASPAAAPAAPQAAAVQPAAEPAAAPVEAKAEAPAQAAAQPVTPSGDAEVKAEAPVPGDEMSMALEHLRTHMEMVQEEVLAYEEQKARAPSTMALGGEAAGIQAAVDAEQEVAPQPVEIGDYDPDLTQGEANDAASGEDACIVSCGDTYQPIEDALSPAEKARRKRLADLNFPDRPADWPPMMQWPSSRDLDILERYRGDRATIDAYVANLMDMNVQMRRRADQMRGFLDSHREKVTLREFIARQRKIDGKRLWRPDEVASMGVGVAARGTKGLGRWAMPKIVTPGEDPRDRDPQRGIKFALLLDPAAIGANSHLVSSWSEDKIRTISGCNVYATNSDITFRVDPRYRDKQTGIPDDAITISIREGKSRGWKHFDVQGTRRFAKAFERKALEEGISATIRYRNKFGKMVTLQVAPIVPGVNDQTMQWAPKAPRTPAGAEAAQTAEPGAAPEAGEGAGRPAASGPATAGLAPLRTGSAFKSMKPMPAAATPAPEPEQAPASKMTIAPTAVPKAEAKPEIDIDAELDAVLGKNPDLDHSPAPQLA